MVMEPFEDDEEIMMTNKMSLPEKFYESFYEYEDKARC